LECTTNHKFRQQKYFWPAFNGAGDEVIVDDRANPDELSGQLFPLSGLDGLKDSGHVLMISPTPFPNIPKTN